MIVEEAKEYLLGTNKINFDKVIDEAAAIHNSFTNYSLDWTSDAPIYMDNDSNLCFHAAGRKNAKKTDVTKYALSQAASVWGIPSRYIIDLYDKDMGALAVKNINELNAYNAAHDRHVNMKAMVSEGVTEAVVSNRFATNFPVCDVLDTVRNSIELDRYIPNQVFLSKSKMHIRFVDFDHKEKVNGEDMTVGFTVDSSDVGKSALRVQFFIYKFSCQNGIVMVGESTKGGRMAGTLYRQKHLGEAFDIDSIEEFKASFDTIKDLRENGLDLVAQSQSRMMSVNEMHRILDASRKNYVSVSDTEREKIIDFATAKYGHSKWGLINGITEVAQDHTLDNRIAYEVWAGHLLQQAM